MAAELVLSEEKAIGSVIVDNGKRMFFGVPSLMEHLDGISHPQLEHGYVLVLRVERG